MKTIYFIGEFSEMTGIPVRTLHYYDETGLLKPSRQDSGHRTYTMDDMVKLQKILSLKSLGFNLAKIKELLKLPQYDQSLSEMLKLQQQSLEVKRKKIEESLELISRITKVLQAEEQLEHHLLFSLIRNIGQEDMQRDWVADHLSEHTAEKLFSGSESDMGEIDAETIHFIREVKRLSVEVIHSEEVEALLGTFIQRVEKSFDQAAVEKLQNLDESDTEKLVQFVDMPFTESEQKWLEQAIEHYLSKYPLYNTEE